MTEPVAIAAILTVFFVAGIVKGVIGLGLPTVSLALLTLIADLPTAMALLLIPSFLTNVWQASVGGHGGAVLRRLWPFLLPATCFVLFGTLALRHVQLEWLAALLGMLLAVYSAINLAGIRFSVSRSNERWMAPLTGATSGLFTGMTGSAVVPSVMYLQAVGLSRDSFIQAMGMSFRCKPTASAKVVSANNMPIA
ncbi:MAG: sulfite exporter TauE/SafE family protein [Pseudomonadota bacterium]